VLLPCYDLKVNTGDPHDPGLRFWHRHPPPGVGEEQHRHWCASSSTVPCMGGSRSPWYDLIVRNWTTNAWNDLDWRCSDACYDGRGRLPRNRIQRLWRFGLVQWSQLCHVSPSLLIMIEIAAAYIVGMMQVAPNLIQTDYLNEDKQIISVTEVIQEVPN